MEFKFKMVNYEHLNLEPEQIEQIQFALNNHFYSCQRDFLKSLEDGWDINILDDDEHVGEAVARISNNPVEIEVDFSEIRKIK